GARARVPRALARDSHCGARWPWTHGHSARACDHRRRAGKGGGRHSLRSGGARPCARPLVDRAHQDSTRGPHRGRRPPLGAGRALAPATRARLRAANPEPRAQLQTPLRSPYDLKIELLRARYDAASAAGRKDEANTLAAAAFATADASRAHSFADVAAQKYSPAVRRALASEFRRREELYRELSARRFALEARLDRSGSGDPRARHLMHDIAELEREADAINTLIATRATPVGGPPRAGSVRASLPPLPADTVLVSYWLGSESAYAWVVSPTEIRWAQLPAPAAIAAKDAAFQRSLTRLIDMPLERRLQDARALYELIIRPI